MDRKLNSRRVKAYIMALAVLGSSTTCAGELLKNRGGYSSIVASAETPAYSEATEYKIDFGFECIMANAGYQISSDGQNVAESIQVTPGTDCTVYYRASEGADSWVPATFKVPERPDAPTKPPAVELSTPKSIAVGPGENSVAGGEIYEWGAYTSDCDSGYAMSGTHTGWSSNDTNSIVLTQYNSQNGSGDIGLNQTYNVFIRKKATDEECNNDLHDKLNENTVLYAKWKENLTGTVTIKSGTNEVNGSTVLKTGDKLTAVYSGKAVDKVTYQWYREGVAEGNKITDVRNHFIL